MPELTYHNNLIIGLGGTGGRVLKELRKRIYDEFDEIPDGSQKEETIDLFGLPLPPVS